jgi:transcriptional regulator with XRE-family HTH domain
MNVELSPLAQQLRELRFHSGLSMRQLAEKADISEAYVSLIESDKRIPSEKILKKIAQILSQDALVQFQLLQSAGYALEQTWQFNAQVSTHTGHEAFEKRLLNSHVCILNGQASEAQHLLTEALPQFSQPIQLQILIAFLEAARQQWVLAERALQTAQEAHRFCPEDLPDQTLKLASGLLYSLKHFFSETSAEALLHLKNQSSDWESTFFKSYFQLVCEFCLARLLKNPSQWQTLAALSEEWLSSFGQHSEELLQWGYRVWLEALIESKQVEGLKHALHLVQMALIYAPKVAELWFKQAQIYQGLYQLSQEPMWQSACWKSLLKGFQIDASAPLAEITRRWPKPIQNHSELLSLTQTALKA